MSESKGTRGGARPGAGRPVGTTKGPQRKQFQVRAHEDEIELIRAFVKLMRNDRAKVEQLLKEME